jgi:hypothetical protein
VYEALEKRRSGKTKTIPPSQAKEEMKAAAATIFQNITFERIVLDVGMSLLMKFALEIALTATYLAAGGHSFAAAYGTFNIETVGRFLRGDHPWLNGNEGIMVLASLRSSPAAPASGSAPRPGAPILRGVIPGRS